MNCPICNGIPNKRFSKKFVDVEKCSGCGHIYAIGVKLDRGVQHLIDPESIFAEYRNRNKRLIAKWQSDGFLSSKMKVLDFGAGSGHLLRSLSAIMPSITIHCVEADSAASEFLGSKGFTVFSDLEDVSSNLYDAILLIELLEHLSDPVNLLEKLKKKLKLNGRIFISTPIGETRNGNRNLHTYETAEHVQFWTENSFNKICKKVNLRFHPIHAGIMYPRRGLLDRLARDVAQSLRDTIQGKRHLVGYLESIRK